MVYLDICPKGLNHIGYLGENEHRTFRFLESMEILAMYPDASVTVLHRRPGDPAGYPIPPGYVKIQDGIVCWTIQSGDLARVGRGKCELVFTRGGVVAETRIYDTMIDQALAGSGEPPDPWQTWVNEIVSMYDQMLLRMEEISGTVQTVTYDDNTGFVSRIVHSRDGVTVRTDVFTYECGRVTEVRTIATGRILTIVTDTTTMQTTITETI